MEREREKRWRAINSSLAIFWVDSFHKRCPDLSINPGGEIDDYMYKGYEQLGWTRYAKIISDKKDRENFHFARKIEGCAAHREIRPFFSFSLSLSLFENEFPIFFAMLHNSVTLRRDRWLLRLNTLNFNGIPSSRSFHESGIKKFSPRGRGEGTIGI